MKGGRIKNKEKVYGEGKESRKMDKKKEIVNKDGGWGWIVVVD
jgi:hypothetical protein